MFGCVVWEEWFRKCGLGSVVWDWILAGRDWGFEFMLQAKLIRAQHKPHLINHKLLTFILRAILLSTIFRSSQDPKKKIKKMVIFQWGFRVTVYFKHEIHEISRNTQK
jgi:hypothetical protein